MYCRTCGNKINDDAELCVKCGVRRNVGENFCQACGTKTIAGMVTCKKCGAKLMKSLSSAQMKKKAISKGSKTIGTVLLLLSIILLVAGVGQFVVGLMSYGYYKMSMITTGGTCFSLGVGLFAIGKFFKKRK